MFLFSLQEICNLYFFAGVGVKRPTPPPLFPRGAMPGECCPIVRRLVFTITLTSRMYVLDTTPPSEGVRGAEKRNSPGRQRHQDPQRASKHKVAR